MTRLLKNTIFPAKAWAPLIYFAMSSCAAKENMVFLDEIKSKKWYAFSFQCSSKSKPLENSRARSIQIPADRSKTAMSKCPVFPMARSVSTYGPLDKEDTGRQKLIPTGSLPTTLQGATVRIWMLTIGTWIICIWFCFPLF